MAGTCSVCKAQPSKYKCPVDLVSTCSLACSKTHKESSCAGRAAALPLPNRSSSLDSTALTVQVFDAHASKQMKPAVQVPVVQEYSCFSRLESLRELQDLIKGSSSLRQCLRSIYTLTLEENWMETIRIRDNNRGHYRGPQARHLGRWSEEKGFKRGLGKVRRIRNDTDRGNTIDKAAFSQFCRIVLGQETPPND